MPAETYEAHLRRELQHDFKAEIEIELSSLGGVWKLREFVLKLNSQL